MDSRETHGASQACDREFLLSDAKRNQVMTLWELRQYGLDSYGDADYVSIYVSIYGMAPAE